MGWTGEYEWIDEIPFAEMPHALNPAKGFIVSANHKIVDNNYPHFLGKVWRNGYRARRLEELITSRDKISTNDCRRFHLDVFNIPGKQLADLVCQQLATIQTIPDEARISLDLLQTWDGRLTRESIGGTVYEVLIRQLSEVILSPHLDKTIQDKALGMGENPLLQPVNELMGEWLVSLLTILKDGTGIWLSDKESILLICLARTTAVLRQKFGDEVTNWQWGELHQITFDHAFGLVPGLGGIFNQGPFPIGGDGDTVAQTSIRPDLPYDNNAISVSSRFIVDMGHINQAQAMHVPGQSGHLASPHYGDLIHPWLTGSYYPLTWEIAEVTAVAEKTLTLQPAFSKQ